MYKHPCDDSPSVRSESLQVKQRISNSFVTASMSYNNGELSTTIMKDSNIEQVVIAHSTQGKWMTQTPPNSFKTWNCELKRVFKFEELKTIQPTM